MLVSVIVLEKLYGQKGVKKKMKQKQKIRRRRRII